jgi:hypothetical protein
LYAAIQSVEMSRCASARSSRPPHTNSRKRSSSSSFTRAYRRHIRLRPQIADVVGATQRGCDQVIHLILVGVGIGNAVCLENAPAQLGGHDLILRQFGPAQRFPVDGAGGSRREPRAGHFEYAGWLRSVEAQNTQPADENESTRCGDAPLPRPEAPDGLRRQFSQLSPQAGTGRGSRRQRHAMRAGNAIGGSLQFLLSRLAGRAAGEMALKADGQLAVRGQHQLQVGQMSIAAVHI